MPREGNLKDRVTRMLAQAPDTWFVKTAGNPYQRRGLPDLIICHHGLFVGAELKAPGNDRTPSQRVEGRKIVAAGGVTGDCYSVQDVARMMDEAVEQARSRWNPP